MILIDKVVSSIKSDEIEKVLMSDNFPWFWNESTLTEKNDNVNNFMFTHVFLNDGKVNSSYYYLVEAIITSLQIKHPEIKKPFRIKANLLTNSALTDEQNEHEIHTDIDLDNYMSFVYYVSNSDGDTIIYEDSIQKVSPKKNTGVLFKSNMKHRGSSPQNHKRRIVINFVFEV